MEKEKEREVGKLLNVLKRMARTARLNQWAGVREQADGYSIDQFNRILERLQTLEATSAQGLFPPLPGDATWSIVSNACRDLAAYYEDEKPEQNGKAGWNGVWSDAKSGIWIDKSAFKHGMPPEINELGHFIREKIAEWQDRNRERR